MIELLNNFDQTYSVLQSGVIVFTGPIMDAMKEFSRLKNAARPAAKVTARKQQRLDYLAEKKSAGVR